jgi:hypothetical protein
VLEIGDQSVSKIHQRFVNKNQLWRDSGWTEQIAAIVVRPLIRDISDRRHSTRAMSAKHPDGNWFSQACRIIPSLEDAERVTMPTEVGYCLRCDSTRGKTATIGREWGPLFGANLGA